MARRPRPPLDRAKIEKGLSRFMSRHTRDFGLRDGEEAYDFDIKIQKIDIPDIVRQLKSDGEIDEVSEAQMNSRFTIFADSLKEIYPWVKEWYQTGRSGGWLTIVTGEPVLTDNWEIPRSDIREGPKEWAPTYALSAAAKRLEALEEIKRNVENGIDELVGDLESRAWWGITPKDWKPPPKKKPSMGGVFDFLRRKKEPETREIIRATPIEIVPPTGGMVPARPAPGTFANPFEVLAPPTGRALTVPSAPAASPVFEMIAPPAAPPKAPMPIERAEPPAPPAAPLLPAFDILPPRPAAREGRRTGHARDVIDWRLPTPEELAGQLSISGAMAQAFLTVRALRHKQEFLKELRDVRRYGGVVAQPLTIAGAYPEEVAASLGVPPEVVDVYRDRRGGELRPDIWEEVIGPVAESLTQAVEMIKPEDLPGWFGIEYIPAEDVWMFVYFEVP